MAIVFHELEPRQEGNAVLDTEAAAGAIAPAAGDVQFVISNK